MHPQESMTPADSAALDAVRHPRPDIAIADDLAQGFTDMLRHRRGYRLRDWIQKAEITGPGPIGCFADYLRRDLLAVTAGLTLTHSSGVVEGQVNRIKTIKRQMYGRASFALLRARVLLQP
ncbi:transposase [Streptomyces sp. NPDC059037]|uniref:transposase n=1 Tax=Streptomyces sp. NPDC059037 TaxID=3346710 RepID=UPI003679DA82